MFPVAIVALWLAAATLLAGAAALAAPSSALVSLALAGPYALAGALLAIRRGRNAIGWLFLAVMTVWVVSAAADALGGAAVQAGGALPGGFGLWLIWAASWIFLALFALLYCLTLVFPSGSLPSGRLGVVARVSLVIPVVGLTACAFGPHLVGQYSEGTLGRAVANPLGFLPVPDGSWVLFYLATVALLLAGVVSLVVRFVRSSGLERQQLKWFVAALALTGVLVVVVVAVIALAPGLGAAPWAIAVVGYLSIPLAVGVAVFRYRLYEIDLVIRRSLVYIPLTALLAGVYSASVAILQRLFQAVTGNTSDGAVVMGTLLIVGLFTPLRNDLQNRVDRSFRDHRDLERRLGSLVDNIAKSVSRPDQARAIRAFLEVVASQITLGSASGFVGSPPSEELVARIGTAGSAPSISIEVPGEGRAIGRVDLRPPADRSIREADLDTIRTAARDLGAALRDATP